MQCTTSPYLFNSAEVKAQSYSILTDFNNALGEKEGHVGFSEGIRRVIKGMTENENENNLSLKTLK